MPISSGALADKSALILSAAQPKGIKQEALVQDIAGYLAAQPGSIKTAPEIAELLHGRLAQATQTGAALNDFRHRLQPAGIQPSPSL